MTLVGGWLPFVYTNFLWKIRAAKPITTVDIDFGFGEARADAYDETIYEKLSSLDYSERHLRLGRLWPVVLYKSDKMPLDFITFPEIRDIFIKRIIGNQIHINKVEKFDFLLRHRIPIEIELKRGKEIYQVFCPHPAAFLFHKGGTFLEREDDIKRAKDLFYMYFILRYAPDEAGIFKMVRQYKEEGYFSNASADIGKYFKQKSSTGCLMVEKENGPDDYIEDVREDILERFNRLREQL